MLITLRNREPWLQSNAHARGNAQGEDHALGSCPVIHPLFLCSECYGVVGAGLAVQLRKLSAALFLPISKDKASRDAISDAFNHRAWAPAQDHYCISSLSLLFSFLRYSAHET